MANKFFWIGGYHTVDEALKNYSRNILRILSTNKNINLYNRSYKILEICSKNKIDNLFINYDFNHQGYAALIEEKTIKYSKKINNILNNENIVILDNVTNVYNIGSIIRTCAAFDIKHIIIDEKNYKSNSPIIYKVSCGATEHINIIIVKNIARTIDDLKSLNYWIYTFDNNSKSQDVNDLTFDKKNVLIFGSENKGARELVKKKTDFFVKININKKINSLNVSNAVAAALSIFKTYKN